ncbi:P-type DNA transfer protein VirB5 [Pseudomonas sp. hsmgli-8]|uniref:P-type DNA transfer protein VirB5 n=1 Tax=Pseudomonas quercus TaxID=2722792 RepID=A0ABX0YKP8_9PSED|nr:P-type DNA transfer protein VirB5 [Pseudomonas quercus]NJP03482.1 P-type DNA transfer protein VirB5 [Pseudomonas quercus]
MKKHAMAYALSAVMLAGALPAMAAGVPTLDAVTAAILESNALAQAKQALAALNTAKDAIRTAEQQYSHYKSIVTGNDRLGGFLNDPALNKVLPLGGWSDVYSTVQDIAGLRQRYGLVSDNPSVQARFDQMLAAADALERNYNASTQRISNAEQLRARLDQVETPQQKEDLQLRYQQELIEQQNQQMRLANMKMLQDQQEKIEDTKRAQDFKDYMSGKTTVRPQYD